MDFLTAVFIYFLIWWMVLFTVLPLGVERHTEDGKGYDAGAPRKADMKRKFILTSLISLGILLVIYILVDMDVINLERIYKSDL